MSSMDQIRYLEKILLVLEEIKRQLVSLNDSAREIRKNTELIR
ncbi:MAG: hypothetical protein ACFFCZ_09520 [Promethearchaeota archaeon]